ncbi:MAG: HAMP domain-containing histidine kinase [Myxococcales bacterium]|nr:HAMP domain-containing histidine kinase [Myxococcales bacterium]
MRAKLHRRLFVAFASAILVTGLVTGLTSAMLSSRGPAWATERQRMVSFAGESFAAVWRDPAGLEALAQRTARTLDVDVVVRDKLSPWPRAWGPRGPIEAPVCAAGASLRAPVRLEAHQGAVGSVELCLSRHGRPLSGSRFLTVLGLALVVLWTMAGRVSRRLARPLEELVEVVESIGAGKLERRAQSTPERHGEVGYLALAVNEMAARIAAQMAAQRELLAAVSHEIRSPLARMRFQLETLRGASARDQDLDELDRELQSIDALVGDLLASSRIDFDALAPSEIDAVKLAIRALERAEVDASVLAPEGPEARVRVDATLATVAIANLLSNARKHGQRVVALRIATTDAQVVFRVDDDGAGFAEGEAARAFEPFWRADRARSEGRPGVGLGLALVRRIAEVHGGAAWAENRAEGRGARVSVSFPRVLP